MDRIRIEVVLVKLGAVLILVYALQGLSTYTTFIYSGSEIIGAAILAFALNFLVPAVIAYVLWSFPNTVVGRLSGQESTEDNRGADPLAVLTIGVSLIGLYAFVFGVVDLLYFEALRFNDLKMAEESGFDQARISSQIFAGRITNIAQIMMGVILIFGRRQISTLLRRFRRIGADTDEH